MPYIGETDEPVPPLPGPPAPIPPLTPAATQPAAQAAAQPGMPLVLTVQNAILAAIEENRELRVQQLNPAIRKTAEDQAQAAFDPTLASQISSDRTRISDTDNNLGSSTAEAARASVAVSEFLPTGTALAATGTTTVADSAPFSDSPTQTRLGLTATQALLRGFGTNVNYVALRASRIDTLSSLYELRGFTEALVGRVETTYWDYALAQRQIDIFVRSRAVAQQQFEETQEMVRVGKLAESELAAAEAEVALREENLINARSALERTRLELIRLLGAPNGQPWDRAILLENQPFIPGGVLDPVEQHVAVALKMRPDLNQARLQVQRGDLEIVRTRNGLLPRLDLFTTLGKTGYANSFGNSARNIFEGDSYDAQVGLSFEFPPLNRDARAQHRRAVLTLDQSRAAVENLAQLVEVDVRTAYIEVLRTREQITATAASRRLSEEKFRAEAEKFRVGKSTTLLVAQVERDLTVSQLAEIQVIVGHLKALVDLYRLEGSLLERRGIVAPGERPVAAR